MKRVIGVYIVVSLILIFFLKSSAESDKAWLELYSEKYDNSPVVDIIKDHNKDLYLATSTTFYKINDNNILKEIDIDAKFKGKKILKIYPSKKGSIYVLFEAGNNECIVTEYYNSKWTELGQLEMNHKVFFGDSKNRLWSSDYKSNILLFKNNKWVTIKYNSGFFKTQNVHWPEEAYDKKSFNPIIFLEDNKGRIWIYSSVISANYISMVEILCFYNDEIYIFPLRGLLQEKLIYRIMEVKPDIFWIGTYGEGISVFKVIEKNKKLELTSLGYSPNNFSQGFLLDYYKDSKNRIWFIAQSGLETTGHYKYQALWYLKEDKIELVRQGIDDFFGGYFKLRQCFEEDMNGNIFVGTIDMGVLLFNGKGEIKEINRLNGLKISTARSIISDKNGNIFFIPDYLDSQKFNISSIQILNQKWVNRTDKIDKIRTWKTVYTQGDIKKDSNGNLWWLSEDDNKIRSLIKYNGEKIKTIANISDMIKNIEKKFNYKFSILYFTIDSKDKLWFYIMGPNIIYIVIYDGTNFTEVYDIKEAYKNIALNGDENYKLGTDDFREETYNPIVTKDKEIFYTGWSNTVYYFNGEKWIDYDMYSIAGEKFSILNPLFVNSEGYVVATAFTNYDIDTDKVSYIFKDGKWEKSQNYFYNPYYGKKSDLTYKDNKGNTFIFIFSDRNCLQYKDLNNNLYRIDDIMCPIPFDENPLVVKIFEDIKGDIWFKYYGSSTGNWQRWAILDVSKLKELIKEPVSIISFVKVGQKVMSLQLSKEIEIDKIEGKIKSDSITVKFSVENENNVKVKFSWRLDEGVWSEPISSDSAILRNLLKGKHIFEVKAIDSRGISTKKPAKLEFTIDYDYTQKLDKIFNKLKSNDDKMIKESIEEFISLKTISKEYLARKLNETSDEALRWKINAILSRIE